MVASAPAGGRTWTSANLPDGFKQCWAVTQPPGSHGYGSGDTKDGKGGRALAVGQVQDNGIVYCVDGLILKKKTNKHWSLVKNDLTKSFHLGESSDFLFLNYQVMKEAASKNDPHPTVC